MQRAELGGALNNRELLDIAAVLRTTRTVSAYCDGAEERNCLRPLFRALTPDRTLEDSITGSIISEEEIADTASSTYPHHLGQGPGGAAKAHRLSGQQIFAGGHYHHPF